MSLNDIERFAMQRLATYASGWIASSDIPELEAPKTRQVVGARKTP
ncbi:hypothetical protein [Neorhizobium lilium]|nr:hypothetical protein [Neorhizobium lilium]